MWNTHANGCAKLKNDPGQCQLVRVAASGWLAEEKIGNELSADQFKFSQHNS